MPTSGLYLEVLGLPKRFTFQTEEKVQKQELKSTQTVQVSLKESGKREGYIFTTVGEGRFNCSISSVKPDHGSGAVHTFSPYPPGSLMRWAPSYSFYK